MVVYSYTVATGNKLDVNKPRVSHDTLISKLAQSLTPHQRSPTHGDGARRRSPAAPPALPPPPTSSRMLCAQRGGRSRRDSVALESCSSASVRRFRAERCNTPLARAAARLCRSGRVVRLSLPSRSLTRCITPCYLFAGSQRSDSATVSLTQSAPRPKL